MSHDPTGDTTKVAQATGLLQQWVDQQSHDRCWYYPEIFRQLCDLFGVQPTLQPGLPPRPEFELGCKRYQDEEFGK